MALVIVNFHAIVIEYWLFAPAVFKAVQVDLYSCSMQQPDLVEEVEDSPIIYRIWYIQAHNM